MIASQHLKTQYHPRPETNPENVSINTFQLFIKTTQTLVSKPDKDFINGIGAGFFFKNIYSKNISKQN